MGHSLAPPPTFPGDSPRPAGRSGPGAYQITAFALGHRACEILCASSGSQAEEPDLRWKKLCDIIILQFVGYALVGGNGIWDLIICGFTHLLISPIFFFMYLVEKDIFWYNLVFSIDGCFAYN